MTDDDLQAILVCTDAVNKLKRLKLFGLVNVVGHGLEPLHSMVVLEQIDMSLIKQRGFSWSIEPELLAISEAAVIPILDTIISRNGNFLKDLQLPHKWLLREQSEILSAFLRRHNRLFESQPFNCAGCTDRTNCTGSSCALELC